MAELFLIAELAGRRVAFPSADVESVVDIGQIVPVPLVPREVAGVAALRSRVVTVIDSRVALGMPADGRARKRAVVAAVDGHSYALLVDALDDVTPLDCMSMGSGVALDDNWSRAVCGLVERDGEPIPVLRPAALVPGSMALVD